MYLIKELVMVKYMRIDIPVYDNKKDDVWNYMINEEDVEYLKQSAKKYGMSFKGFISYFLKSELNNREEENGKD